MALIVGEQVRIAGHGPLTVHTVNADGTFTAEDGEGALQGPFLAGDIEAAEGKQAP